MTSRTHAQGRAQVREGPGPGEQARAGATPRDVRPPLFRFGMLVATPGALRELGAAGETPLPYLARHAAGDWGELGAEDRAANDRALRTGERLLSAYRLPNGARIWIITEADRSSSCLLLPEEY